MVQRLSCDYWAATWAPTIMIFSSLIYKLNWVWIKKLIPIEFGLNVGYWQPNYIFKQKFKTYTIVIYILGDHVKDALLVKFGWIENLKIEFHKEYILKRIIFQSCIKIVIYGHFQYYSLVVKFDYHPYKTNWHAHVFGRHSPMTTLIFTSNMSRSI